MEIQFYIPETGKGMSESDIRVLFQLSTPVDGPEDAAVLAAVTAPPPTP